MNFARMADFTSDSGSDYGYDLTTSDEEQIWTVIDELAPESPQIWPAPAVPESPAPGTNSSAPARTTVTSSPFDPDINPNTNPDFDPDASLVEEVVAAITDDDLSFDVSELQEDNDDAYGQGQGAAYVQHSVTRNSTPDSYHRRLAPSVARDDGGLASFVATTKPRSIPTLLPGPDVSYPDLSRALFDAQDVERSKNAKSSVAANDSRSPLLRFRTFPMKPFSVSDLTAGSWCELQYFYTLTRLPGGKRTRTAAMKRGTKLHKKLERELFTPVEVAIAKKEDNFGLKIWNMIQGLRTLRDQGFTREFEVWGMVEGNLVCGVIDRMSSENPDAELQEDVLSNRGSSQTITNSQPYELSTPSDYEIFISDVKSRSSASPPPQSQVRVSLIQLFLYHRFMSDMASDRLDYMRVFERYGLNPDEPFSDAFIAQIGAVHDEVFTEADAETASTLSNHEATDVDSNAEFVSAPSSPSQVSFADSSEPKLKYGSLRTLVSLLKFELALTFPRGASDLGKIVAVEYRYRGRDPSPPNPIAVPTATTTDPDPATTDLNGLSAAADDDETDPAPAITPQRRSRRRRGRSKAKEPEADPKPETAAPEADAEPKQGSVICTHTFFVEPETLDMYLSETMRWWRGERAPRGVAPEDANFKCRLCEFRDECEWRAEMDRENLRRAQSKKSARAREREENGSEQVGVGVMRAGLEAEEDVEVEEAATAGAVVAGGDIEEAGGGGPSKAASGGKRRGRPRKADKEMEKEREIDADADAEAEVEVEDRQRVKRGRGRPRKSTAAGGVYA